MGAPLFSENGGGGSAGGKSADFRSLIGTIGFELERNAGGISEGGLLRIDGLEAECSKSGGSSVGGPESTAGVSVVGEGKSVDPGLF